MMILMLCGFCFILGIALNMLLGVHQYPYYCHVFLPYNEELIARMQSLYGAYKPTS